MGGCFWGGELEYMRVPGVVATAVGYTQGEKIDPSYKEVCSGTTGHTEAIQVVYNPDTVSYETLVSIGLERLGDSRTLLNQVGNDRGTQYRHGVYYHNDEQKEIAQKVISSYGELFVTECEEASVFYKAEDYHHQYLLKGGQSASKKCKRNHQMLWIKMIQCTFCDYSSFKTKLNSFFLKCKFCSWHFIFASVPFYTKE